jgi:hypothetical protein
MYRGSLLPFVLVLVSCRGATEPADIRVALETDFHLALGGTAEVEDAGLRLEFSAVPEDSRCPPHAFCVWAGDARIELVVWEAGLAGWEREDAVLHTNPSIGPSAVIFDVYVLQLMSLRPEFRTGERPEYVVTLRVVELNV